MSTTKYKKSAKDTPVIRLLNKGEVCNSLVTKNFIFYFSCATISKAIREAWLMALAESVAPEMVEIP